MQIGLDGNTVREALPLRGAARGLRQGGRSMAVADIATELTEFVGKDNVKTGAAAIAGYFADPVKETGLVLVRPADEYELAEVADEIGRAHV